MWPGSAVTVAAARALRRCATRAGRVGERGLALLRLAAPGALRSLPLRRRLLRGLPRDFAGRLLFRRSPGLLQARLFLLLYRWRFRVSVDDDLGVEQQV